MVERHKEDYSSPDQERPGGLSEEGAFVSPEELEGLLAALDKQDGRFLDSGESLQNADEGDFLSPEDLGSSPAQDTIIQQTPAEAPSRRPQTHPRAGIEIEDPALLSRIASELRSIKSELSHLKTSYDDTISQTLSQTSNQSSTSIQTESLQPQVPQMPEALYQEMKKLLGYLDRLLESLPEDKIDQFARSEYFDLYRKVFEYFELV
ncbi:MAG: hypothetical protein RBT73_07820 [Spirochaetia bacterium]|nr:hypothetical protein [Spirochaetia bacterium]